MDTNHELLDRLRRFLRDYNDEELSALWHGYPNDKTSLYVDYADLWNFDPDVADDYQANHDTLNDYLTEAVQTMDCPVDVSLSDVSVRVTDRDGYLDRRRVDSLGSAELGDFVAVSGQIGDVTEVKPRMERAAFGCQRCGTITEVEQPFLDSQEAHQCVGCERKGPFSINFNKSELVDQCKIKLEQPPEQQVGGTPQHIVTYVLGDLIENAGGSGLHDRAGSRVTILGKYNGHWEDKRGQNEPVLETYFVAESLHFDEDTDDGVDVEEHRGAVEDVASRDDAVDLFARNISPGLTVTDQWEDPIVMATAYLFGAPRIDVKGGGRFRGDLHMLFVSDPGMYKSEFAEDIAELSPDGHHAEATDMASSVGLTSAAVKDGFGDGQFTLKPGALPRANGGHLILDEVDKGPAGFLDGVHGALEGAQKLRVNKAGMSAELPTRVGFMAVGNPVDGTFDANAEIANQIDMDPALMSRFDLIATMQDSADEAHDTQVADGVLDGIDQSMRVQTGDMDMADADSINPEVPRDVMRAWVKLARDEIDPLLTPEAKAELKEFYVDTRQLNGSDSENMPATARTLVAGWRLAAAFARCELSDTIERRHAERAREIGKKVVGQNFDSETLEFDASRTAGSLSQKERADRIRKCVKDEPKTAEAVASETGIAKSKVLHRLDEWRNDNRAIKTQDGEYRWVA